MEPTTISATSARPEFRRPRRGFTLVELLVAIGIVVALAALALPLLVRAYRTAGRATSAAALQAVATALDAYKADFNEYPRVIEPDSGAHVLCRALVAPGPAAQDGADGNGFRPRGPMGRVYGPYLQPDQFIIDSDRTRGNPVDFTRVEIRDKWDNPILYFPAAANKPDIHSGVGFVGTSPGRSLYNASDNLSAFRRGAGDALERIRVMLGDLNNNGRIDSGESPVTTGPYLLWSAGEDGQYGPARSPFTPDEITKCDDVTNFR